MNRLPSMTVPNQTLSIQEILIRHTRGLPLDVPVKKPQYSNVYTPDFRELDLVDRQEMSESNLAIAEEYAKTMQERKEAKEQERIQKLAEELLKKQQENANSNTAGTIPANSQS